MALTPKKIRSYKETSSQIIRTTIGKPAESIATRISNLNEFDAPEQLAEIVRDLEKIAKHATSMANTIKADLVD